MPFVKKVGLRGSHFARVRELIHRLAGIALPDDKESLIIGRLTPRLAATRLSDFDDYLALVERDERERQQFINSLTTNVTDFFRERHHFDALKAEILPRLYRAPSATGKLRLWSAGCSSGEEPYSLAMTLLSAGRPMGFDVKILATDLDSEVLGRAAQGVFPEARLEPIDEVTRSRFFEAADEPRHFRVVAQARNLVTFRQLNLLGPWPITLRFDAIFCRNVMIYFDDATRKTLVDRFVAQLAPGGVLMLGHSESMMGMHPGLEPIGRTMFRKRDAVRGAA